MHRTGQPIPGAKAVVHRTGQRDSQLAQQSLDPVDTVRVGAVPRGEALRGVAQPAVADRVGHEGDGRARCRRLGQQVRGCRLQLGSRSPNGLAVGQQPGQPVTGRTEGADQGG
ncbi:hypothetical protein JCM9534A_75010 [Catenuloplanes indicus JCM 9534]